MMFDVVGACPFKPELRVLGNPGAFLGILGLAFGIATDVIFQPHTFLAEAVMT